MKILHFSKWGGGLNVYIDEFSSFVQGPEFAFQALVSAVDGPPGSFLRERGWRVEVLPLKREISLKSDVTATCRLIARFARERPDVLHLHSSKGGAVGRLAALVLGVPVIYVPHALATLGRPSLTRSLFHLVELALSTQTDLYLGNSASDAARIRSELALPLGKVGHVTNGLAFAELDAVARAQDDESEYLVLMVGRLNYQKNPQMFVRAAAQVPPVIKGRRVRFAIAGAGLDDECGDEIHGLAASLGLAERFAILPWMPRAEVLALIKSASLLCVPSNFESFGYVAAEAQYLGLPVVATRVDGLRDIVADGRTGRLIDRDDDQAMAGAVAEILGAEDLRYRMGSAGRVKARRDFDGSRNMTVMKQIYHDLRSQFGNVV